jgi:hypothetical protein
VATRPAARTLRVLSLSRLLVFLLAPVILYRRQVRAMHLLRRQTPERVGQHAIILTTRSLVCWPVRIR